MTVILSNMKVTFPERYVTEQYNMGFIISFLTTMMEEDILSLRVPHLNSMSLKLMITP